MNKLVYSFAEGDGKNKKLLGGKGANLCEMTQIGINVPPGFVITTEACLEYLDGNTLPAKPATWAPNSASAPNSLGYAFFRWDAHEAHNVTM